MRTGNELRLCSAVHDDDVITLVRDYVAAWPPEDLAQLPPECRPGRFVDAFDVNQFAFFLTRHRFEAESQPYFAMLTEMEAFFAQAATRLAQLQLYAMRKISEPRHTAPHP